MIVINQQWKKIDLGNDITVEIKPLSVSAYHAALVLLMKHDIDKGTEKEKAAIARKIISDPEVVPVIKNVLPGHVQNIIGLQVEDGDKTRDITVEEFCGLSQCLIMCVTIISQLVAYSQLSVDEEKN